MRAGLLDRAEALFGELVTIQARETDALRQLVKIYQQERDWEQAVAYAQRLADLEGDETSAEVAQYLCELAAVAMQDGDTDAARQHVDEALRRDPQCVRASIMQGRLAEASEDLEGALTAWQRVADQDPDFLPEVIEPILKTYDRLGRSPRRWLEDMIVVYRGVAPVLALAKLVKAEEGDAAAVELLRGHLQRRPSVRGLHYLVEINLETSTGEARENLLILHALINEMLRGIALYRCDQCGYGGRVPHWQCPSCKTWDAVKPIRGLTLS